MFDRLAAEGHEQLVHCHDAGAGLRAIVAIHNTQLGPALGGVRMWPYANGDAALADVVRLARGMTYKNALAGLELGGGKAVIIGDPQHDRTETRMRCFGRFLDTLGGRYITAEDVGMTSTDMDHIRRETPWVVGTDLEQGGSGDPSPFTALGVLAGIRACLRERYGHAEVGACHYAVQGAGHVGMELVRHLHAEGARITVCDIDTERAQQVASEFGCEVVDTQAIYTTGADVFVPCALGGAITSESLARLECDIIAGPANNQLSEPAVGDEIDRRGIVHAPDYAINSGGVMNVALELGGYRPDRARAMALGIQETVTTIFERARADAIPAWLAADRIAEARIEAAATTSHGPATPIVRAVPPRAE